MVLNILIAISTMILLFTMSNEMVLGQNICFKYDANQANKDIANGKLQLLRSGGVASIIIVPQDSIVEKRFGIKYEDFGDTQMDSDSCIKAYSKVVFAHLDKTHGEIWRRVVRKDTRFLKEIPYHQ